MEQPTRDWDYASALSAARTSRVTTVSVTRSRACRESSTWSEEIDNESFRFPVDLESSLDVSNAPLATDSTVIPVVSRPLSVVPEV
ncbi:hypothetical protein V2G26_010639 [Clonostachys chloroleuca]